MLTWLVAAVAYAEITPTDSQMWWGYFSKSEATNLPYDGNLGYNKACTLDAAIYIPAGEEMVGNSTIKAIRIWLGQEISSIDGDMKVWISTSKPTDVTQSACIQTVSHSSLKKGLNDIELTTPFKVNNKGIYVGFTFAIKQAAYPIMSGGADAPNSFFVRVDNGDWNDLSDYGYGKLSLQILLDGGTYPSNQVDVSDFGQRVVLKGQSSTVAVTITNKGKNTISNVSYVVSTEGGVTTEEKKVLLTRSLDYNSSATISVSFPSDEESKKYKKTLTLTKVNNVENESEKKTGTGYLITVTEVPKMIPVVEEFTGTWCGYCPYGIVAMEKAHETYGDDVVLIAAHNGDVMQISGYDPITNGVGSFPSADVNRTGEFYPSTSALNTKIKNAQKLTTQGSIQLMAMWTSASKTAIDFTTQSTFVYDDDSGQYGIAYVLVADGLTGSGSNWAQSNYLSGQSGDDEMSYWYSASSKIYNYKFDHVAVAAWDITNGVDESVEPVIRAGQTQYYTFRGSIQGNSLVQDKSKLTAVALLIDRVSGRVVNAAQAPIQDYVTGIDDVEDMGNAQTTRYTIDGRKISSPQKGINILKTADGRTVKVLVK